MRKIAELLNEIDYGDLRVIAEIHNKKHLKTDRQFISSSYVGKLLNGERGHETETAKEIIEIAKAYLTKKHNIKNELIAA